MQFTYIIEGVRRNFSTLAKPCFVILGVDITAQPILYTCGNWKGLHGSFFPLCLLTKVPKSHLLMRPVAVLFLCATSSGLLGILHDALETASSMSCELPQTGEPAVLRHGVMPCLLGVLTLMTLVRYGVLFQSLSKDIIKALFAGPQSPAFSN